MSRVCPLTGKGPLSGNARSHSLRATRRKWNVNLQPVKVEIDGRVCRVMLSTKAIKTLRKLKEHKFLKITSNNWFFFAKKSNIFRHYLNISDKTSTRNPF